MLAAIRTGTGTADVARVRPTARPFRPKVAVDPLFARRIDDDRPDNAITRGAQAWHAAVVCDTNHAT